MFIKKMFIWMEKKLPLNWQCYVWILFKKFKNREEYNYFKQWLPKKVSNGNAYPKTYFFVIRNKDRATGLLSCYLSSLGHLPKVEKERLVPIFDMQSHFYELIHNKSDEGLNCNAWEYYFQQPTEFGMKDIENAKHVEYSRGLYGEHDKVFFGDYEINREFVKKWMYYDEKYIKLNTNLIEIFDKKYEKILKGKRAIGTMIREGYIVYANARDNGDPLYKTHPGIGGHPIQPQLDELVQDLKNKMVKWQCDYVYVVAETMLVINFLNEKLPGKVITTDRKRREVGQLDLAEYRKAGERFFENYERVQSNVDYLEEIYLLSKCTSLSASKCSGSIVASIWNRNNYENIEIYRKGVY